MHSTRPVNLQGLLPNVQVRSKRHGPPLFLVELLVIGGIVGYLYALVTNSEVIGAAAERLWSVLQSASEKVAAPKSQ